MAAKKNPPKVAGFLKPFLKTLDATLKRSLDKNSNSQGVRSSIRL